MPDRPTAALVRDLISALPDGVAPEQRNGTLVLDAPWQLRAIAVAVGLHVDGSCDWSSFQSLLGEPVPGDPLITDGGEGGPGYERWVATLEELVATMGLVTPEELEERAGAYLSRPPGHDHDHDHAHDHDHDHDHGEGHGHGHGPAQAWAPSASSSEA